MPFPRFRSFAALPRANLLVLAAFLILGGVPVAAGQDSTPFRLIVTHLEPPLVPNSVMDLALERGYFAAEGVEVDLVRVQQTPSALAALRAGEGDMANIGLDALLLSHARGQGNLVAITSPNTALPFLIAARDDFETVADLAGARFAVGRLGSLDHNLSRSVLAAEGLDLETLSLVALGQPAVRAQALVAERIDATTMSIGVWLALPDTSGLRVLVDPARYFAAAPVVNKVNVVPRSVLAERRAEVEGVLRALVRLSRDFSADPALWVEAITPYAGAIAPDDLAQLAASFAGSWSVNGGMSAPDLAFSQEWLHQGEDFAGLTPLPLDQWVDFSPIDAVLAEIGVDETGDPPLR